MVQFSGNFTNEDLKGDTGRKDQEEKIVQQIIDTFAPEMMTGQVSSDTLNRLQDSYVAKGGSGLNPYMRERNKQQQIGDYNNVNSVQSPFTTVKRYPGGEGIRELLQNYNSQGIASVAPVNPMAQERAADYMRALQMGQTEDYKDFFFDEASRDPSMLDPVRDFFGNLLGYDTDSMRGLYEMEQDKKAAMARDQELGDDRRKDQEERERAALLAAQNQPVDPCPEGYRLDPMSKVCVPTDDMTTDTAPGTGRVYETMTAPQENYTAATNFNVPSINLPDVLSGVDKDDYDNYLFGLRAS